MRLSKRGQASLAKRERAISLERLERRQMLALIGLTLQDPGISYDSGGTVSYTAGTQTLSADTTPLFIRFNQVDPPIQITGARDMLLNIQVNNAGSLVGGVPGDDLIITGDIDVDGDTVPEYSGTLLTGEVSAFGYLDSLDTDQYEFKFTPTGGALSSFFAGKEIGVLMTSTNSTFADSFAVDFGGNSQGTIGAIEIPQQRGGIFGCVFLDCKCENGIHDDGEEGIEGVLITLKDSSGNVVATTTTDADGLWSFSNLAPGTYTVIETQPAQYGDGPESLNNVIIPNAPSTTDTIIVEVGADQNAGEYCFAEEAGCIYGGVYVDKNNNGVRDYSEPAIIGVTITLKDGNGNVVASTTTDDCGLYSFHCLPAGTYTICEKQPKAFGDGLESLNGTVFPNTVGTDSIVVNLDPGECDGYYNFGEVLGCLSGYAYVDFNCDGIFDTAWGDTPLANVKIGLKDQYGNVIATTYTNSSGFYKFECLLGQQTYTLYEVVQPSGYADGKDTPGTINGNTVGTSVEPDKIVNIVLPGGACGIDYNFGEKSKGTTLTSGDTGTIGFWQNRNGQALLLKLNGAASSVKLGNWLATSFPSLYGKYAGSYNLTNKSNTYVASLFTYFFNTPTPPKVQAQVLATAFALYVTDSKLAGTVAAAYGFTVTSAGIGGKLINVGSSGAAFGVANNTTRTILQLLQYTNSKAVKGILYNGNSTLSNQANVVFSAVNRMGDIL